MSKAKNTAIIDNGGNSFAFLNSFKPYANHNARNGKHKVYAKLNNHRQKQSTMADGKTRQVNVPEVPPSRPVEVQPFENKINQVGYPKNRKTAQTTATQTIFKDKCCNNTTSTFVNPSVSMKIHVPYVKDIVAMQKLNEATANLNSALMQAREQLENSNLQDSIDVVKTLLATVNENEEVFYNNMSNIQNIAKNSLNVPETKFENKKVRRKNHIKSPRAVDECTDVLSKNVLNIHDMAKNNPYEPKRAFKDFEVHQKNYIESPRQVNGGDIECSKKLVNIQEIAKSSLYAPKQKFESSFLGPKIESTKKKVYRECYKEFPRGVYKNDEAVTKNVSNIQNITREKLYVPKLEFKNKGILKKNNIESPREVNKIDDVVRKNMVNFQNIEKSSFLGPKIESAKKKVYREFYKESPRRVNKNDEAITKNVSNIQKITTEKLYVPKIEFKNKDILKKNNIESPKEVDEIDDVIGKHMGSFENIAKNSFIAAKMKFTKKKVKREYNIELPRVESDEANNIINIQNNRKEKLYATKIEDEEVYKKNYIESSGKVNERYDHIEKKSLFAAEMASEKRKILDMMFIDSPEELNESGATLNDNMANIYHITEKNIYAPKTKLTNKEVNEKDNIESPRAIDYLNTLFAAMEKADKAKRRFKGMKSRNRRYNNFARKTFSSAYKRLNLEKSAIKLKLKLQQILNKKPIESLPSSYSDSEYDTASGGLKVTKPKEFMFCCRHHAGVKRYLKKNKMNNGKLLHIISEDKMEPPYKNVGTNCTYMDFKELHKPMANTADTVHARKKLNNAFAQIPEGKFNSEIKDRKHAKAKDTSLNWINKYLYFNYMCENCLEGSDNSFYYD